MDYTCPPALDYLDSKDTMMKYFISIILSFLLLISCGTAKSGYRNIEGQTVYLYTDGSGWDVFEVNSRGKTLNEMTLNAKSEIIQELILYGYRGKINISPLLTNPIALKDFETSRAIIVEDIISDANCVKLYSRNIEGRVGPRSQSLNQATMLIQVNMSSIKNKLKQYYEQL